MNGFLTFFWAGTSGDLLLLDLQQTGKGEDAGAAVAEALADFVRQGFQNGGHLLLRQIGGVGQALKNLGLRWGLLRGLS